MGNIKRKRRLRIPLNSDGFTITELIISLVAMGILIVVATVAIVNYLVIVTRNNITIDMTVDSQNLLRSTVEELRYGSGVQEMNSISDANEPSGGWTTSNVNFVIIIAVPAQDSDRNYIINPNTGAPYNNELVYFKMGNNLFRRTLANPNAPNNAATTTCPESASSSSCPPDVLLTENIVDMVFTLYDQDDGETTNPALARSVKIDLSMERDSFGDPLRLDNSIRVTLRNRFQ